jgi:hypothetical protein
MQKIAPPQHSDKPNRQGRRRRAAIERQAWRAYEARESAWIRAGCPLGKQPELVYTLDIGEWRVVDCGAHAADVIFPAPELVGGSAGDDVPPPPVETGAPDRDHTWRVAAGLSSGPPPPLCIQLINACPSAAPVPLALRFLRLWGPLVKRRPHAAPQVAAAPIVNPCRGHAIEGVPDSR